MSVYPSMPGGDQIKAAVDMLPEAYQSEIADCAMIMVQSFLQQNPSKLQVEMFEHLIDRAILSLSVDLVTLYSEVINKGDDDAILFFNIGMWLNGLNLPGQTGGAGQQDPNKVDAEFDNSDAVPTEKKMGAFSAFKQAMGFNKDPNATFNALLGGGASGVDRKTVGIIARGALEAQKEDNSYELSKFKFAGEMVESVDKRSRHDLTEMNADLSRLQARLADKEKEIQQNQKEIQKTLAGFVEQQNEDFDNLCKNSKQAIEDRLSGIERRSIGATALVVLCEVLSVHAISEIPQMVVNGLWNVTINMGSKGVALAWDSSIGGSWWAPKMAGECLTERGAQGIVQSDVVDKYMCGERDATYAEIKKGMCADEVTPGRIMGNKVNKIDFKRTCVEPEWYKWSAGWKFHAACGLTTAATTYVMVKGILRNNQGMSPRPKKIVDPSVMENVKGAVIGAADMITTYSPWTAVPKLVLTHVYYAFTDDPQWADEMIKTRSDLVREINEMGGYGPWLTRGKYTEAQNDNNEILRGYRDEQRRLDEDYKSLKKQIDDKGIEIKDFREKSLALSANMSSNLISAVAGSEYATYSMSDAVAIKDQPKSVPTIQPAKQQQKKKSLLGRFLPGSSAQASVQAPAQSPATTPMQAPAQGNGILSLPGGRRTKKIRRRSKKTKKHYKRKLRQTKRKR
jgi:hypothetical protein